MPCVASKVSSTVEGHSNNYFESFHDANFESKRSQWIHTGFLTIMAERGFSVVIS